MSYGRIDYSPFYGDADIDCKCWLDDSYSGSDSNESVTYATLAHRWNIAKYLIADGYEDYGDDWIEIYKNFRAAFPKPD